MLNTLILSLSLSLVGAEEVTAPMYFINNTDGGNVWVGQKILSGEPERVGKFIALYKYVQPSPQEQLPTADSYGFLAWLNNYRIRNGRRPVGHDPNLSGQAAVNNQQQHIRGMGHHFFGSARRQNAGMGPGATVWQMWTTSPGHNDALLDPNISMAGIAASGSYWTFNAY